MSEKDVLSDVIDEIHDSERFLNPGEVPDRAIFKHVKILWQLLLGINEAQFDSHHYEIFELRFENSNAKFSGLTFLGTDRSSVAKNIGNAVGLPSKSLRVVQMLDEEDTDDTQETSVSFKLSLLNKIRYILFEHHVMVKDFFNDDELKIVIASFLQNDISFFKSGLGISMNSNNHIFNICYKECVETVIYRDDYAIEELTQKILELFNYKAGVAYFFDSTLVLKFHHQMISLLKRIYRNHKLVSDEIDDFFTHNPILPILKPVFRKVALQLINNEITEEVPNTFEDSNETTEYSGIIEKLDFALLKQILHEITQNNLQTSENYPITLKWFPEIIQYYHDSLTSEGILNIEDDLYITMIKKAALKWVDNEIDTKSFINQLSDLSLIPTAMPYFFQGNIFPNLHMRMALYAVKENIRYCETYFDLWHVRTLKNVSIKKRYCNWKTVMIRIFFEKLKMQKHSVDQIEKVDLYSLNVIRLDFFYQKWKQIVSNLVSKERYADLRHTKTYFSFWTSESRQNQMQKKLANNFFSHNLSRRYMNLWKSAKVCRFPEVVKEFITRRKSLYFQLWKILSLDLKKTRLKADEFKTKTTYFDFFQKWKKQSVVPLLKLEKLEKSERMFKLKLSFTKWLTKFTLIDCEKSFHTLSNDLLLRRFFSQWKNFKKLVDNENILVDGANMSLMQFYLVMWKRIYLASIQAIKFHEQKNVATMMRRWKLKYIEKKIINQLELIQTITYFATWRFEAKISQFGKKKNRLLLQNIFSRWYDKSGSLAERLDNCLEAYPLFKTATYFDCWRKVCLRHRVNEDAADAFRNTKLKESNILVLKWAYRMLNAKYIKIQNSFLNLQRFEKYFRMRELKRYFFVLVRKKEACDFDATNADNFYKMMNTTRYYNIWLTQFDRISSLLDVLISKQDTDNVHLLMQVLSRLQLKMMKVQTDLINAEKFSERWNRIKTKTFFDLWKLKLSSRNSPTPTARAGHNQNLNKRESLDTKMIPELNPYIDLAPKDRGSPEYRPPYLSRMQSVLTGDVSQYEIEQQVDDREENRNTPSSIFKNIDRTPVKFRTPVVRKTSSRVLTNSTIKTTPESSSIFTSAERVRKRNLEERVSRYRQLRSPPKTGNYHLESVEESHHEEHVSQDSSIFDTSSESFGSSTPLKKLDIIKL